MTLTLGPLPFPFLNIMANHGRYTLVGNQLNPAFPAIKIFMLWKQEMTTDLWTSWNQFHTFELPPAIGTSQASFIKRTKYIRCIKLLAVVILCLAAGCSELQTQKPNDQACQLRALMTIEFNKCSQRKSFGPSTSWIRGKTVQEWSQGSC